MNVNDTRVLFYIEIAMSDIVHFLELIDNSHDCYFLFESFFLLVYYWISLRAFIAFSSSCRFGTRAETFLTLIWLIIPAPALIVLSLCWTVLKPFAKILWIFKSLMMCALISIFITLLMLLLLLNFLIFLFSLLWWFVFLSYITYKFYWLLYFGRNLSPDTLDWP